MVVEKKKQSTWYYILARIYRRKKSAVKPCFYHPHYIYISHQIYMSNAVVRLLQWGGVMPQKHYHTHAHCTPNAELKHRVERERDSDVYAQFASGLFRPPPQISYSNGEYRLYVLVGAEASSSNDDDTRAPVAQGLRECVHKPSTIYLVSALHLVYFVEVGGGGVNAAQRVNVNTHAPSTPPPPPHPFVSLCIYTRAARLLHVPRDLTGSINISTPSV